MINYSTYLKRFTLYIVLNVTNFLVKKPWNRIILRHRRHSSMVIFYFALSPISLR